MSEISSSMNFFDQLPVVDPVPANPRQDEIKKYCEMLFDPRYDGFENNLEYLTDLPVRNSLQVKSSPLGVGFEVLDHRTAYIFEKALKIARHSGVKWARIQSGWQRAETTPGVYNFDWLDEIVDGLLGAGIQPWVSLSFGNPLYMAGAEPLPPHGNYFFSPTRFGKEGIEGWQNYCRAMVKHFSSRVTHWEVWNEPNAGFLRKPNTGSLIQPEPPEVYAELVKITYAAVKEIQRAEYPAQLLLRKSRRRASAEIDSIDRHRCCGGCGKDHSATKLVGIVMHIGRIFFRKGAEIAIKAFLDAKRDMNIDT